MPTLKEIAQHVGGMVSGDESTEIHGLATLSGANHQELSFLSNKLYLKDLESTAAGAVILSSAYQEQCPTAAIIVDDPYLAFAKVTHLFAPEPYRVQGIHPSAYVDPSAKLSPSAEVHPGAVVSGGAVLGDQVVIEPNVTIGSGVSIGRGTRIKAGSHVMHDVIIGEHCTIHSGTVIGSDGFGFAPTNGAWQKIAQLGSVKIGNRVDIGANCTIDRGALDDTIIEDDVILDNLIQIAHNVTIGAGTAMASGCAVAGSTTIGKHCIFGGMSGVAGHLSIVDNVHVTAMTMVIKDLKEPGVYSSGTGVMPNKQWKKSIARLRRLDQSELRLKRLEQAIKKDNLE